MSEVASVKFCCSTIHHMSITALRYDNNTKNNALMFPLHYFCSIKCVLAAKVIAIDSILPELHSDQFSDKCHDKSISRNQFLITYSHTSHTRTRHQVKKHAFVLLLYETVNRRQLLAFILSPNWKLCGIKQTS